jgi:hypothetical protein
MDKYPKWTTADFVDVEGRKHKVSLIVQNTDEDEAVSSGRAVVEGVISAQGNTYRVASIGPKRTVVERVKHALGG